MKVYTEVVYKWDDAKNELVEESSKSFDYEGEVTQCGFGGSFGAAISNITRTVKKTVLTPAQKATNSANLSSALKKLKARMKINLPKPAIVENIQKAASGGAKQLKTNLESAASTTKSNVHGVTTAARTGLHEGTSAARAGLHAATDAGRAELHRGADTLKGIWDQARGKGGKKDEGGQNIYHLEKERKKFSALMLRER